MVPERGKLILYKFLLNYRCEIIDTNTLRIEIILINVKMKPNNDD